MPKYAVLSDIHGNLEALEAVLRLCSAVGVDKYILLGDIVGYNADPSRCIQIVRSLNPVAAVRGNHDDYAVHCNMENSGFNPNAMIAIKWTHEHLTAEDIEWLDSLPYKAVIGECNATAVHATLDTPEGWGYIFDVQHATAHLSYQIKPVSFCGHSHVPVAFDKIPFANSERRAVEAIPEWEGKTEGDEDDLEAMYQVADMLTVKLEKGHKYLFNIGSIVGSGGINY